MTLPAFRFDPAPAILGRWGAAADLGRILAAFAAERDLLVVTDAGLRKAGLLEPALASLAAEGFRIRIFDGVSADPHEDQVLACADPGKGAGIVLGFGGGSSMDVAKLAALLLASPQDLDGIYGIGKAEGHRLPLVQVPTTSGTGSEVTNISILTRASGSKMGVVAPQLYPDLVVLDAALTLGLPRLHTAATGIDAMVHAIEASTSARLKNPISDGLARQALELLGRNLVTACETPTDRPAREAMLLGATLAGLAFTNAPVGAVHALAYPLGVHFHVPHGMANALMLGPVLRFNLVSEAAAAIYAGLADAVAAPPGATGDRTGDFLAHMEHLMDRSGAPRRLRDVGVTEEALPKMAADAMLQTRLLGNNPVPVTEADALALYRAAF